MELTKVKLSDVARVEISCVDNKSKPGTKSVRLCNFVDVYHNWAITQDLHDSFMEATASDKEIEALSIKKGQVAFTKDSETRDDIGIPTYIADDFDDVVLGYHNALITPDERKLNGKYLNAFMHSSYIQKYFENNASGSGQRYTLSNDTVNSIPILLPSIKEQEKIGNLFSFIDRKIALNKKMNQKLETMAKRLYDYWFVQFDFPDKNGYPYKTTGGPMIYNQILKREIPAGWEVRKFKDVLSKLSSGKRPKGGIDKSLKDGIPSLGAECIDDLGVFDFQKTPYLPHDFKSQVTTGIIEDKDIAVYKDGAYVGKTTMFQNEFPFKFSTVNEHVFLLHCQDDSFEEYLLFVLKQPEYFSIMQNLGKAKAAQPGLNQDDLKNILILWPSNSVMNSFSKCVKTLFGQLFSNAKENKKLTALRDKLLPLLMNGQVVVG